MSDLSRNDRAVSPEAVDQTVKPVSFLDVALALVEHLRLLVAAPLIAGMLAFGATYLLPPMFTATTVVMAPQQQQSTAAALIGQLGQLGGMTSSMGALSGLKNPADQWVGLLKSRVIADAIVDQFKLLGRYGADFRFEARDALARSTTIEAGKDGMITISVDDEDPAIAADMANAYIVELQKLSATMALTEAAQRRVFFEKQLLEAKNNLVKAETALQAGGVSAGALKTQPEAAVDMVARIKAEIASAEVRVSVMKGYLADGSPNLQQAVTELASLRQQLAKAERNDSPGTRADAGYVPRYREFKYYETLYELMAKQYEIARADEARDGAVIQVVDKALPPEWKSKPKRALVAAIGALVTFVLMLLLVLVRQSIRELCKDSANAERWRHLVAALRTFGGSLR